MNNSFLNVTEEYLPSYSIGRCTVQDGYDFTKNFHEVSVAYLLSTVFGGDIYVLKEINALYEKTPDYLWNGKYWELKTIFSEKAVDSAVRKTLKQIQDNPGGIILFCMKNHLCLESIVSYVRNRVVRSNINDSIEVILLSHEIQVFRYVK